jgi:ribosomal silencing factor RsfS
LDEKRRDMLVHRVLKGSRLAARTPNLICARSIRTRDKAKAEEEANQLLDKLYHEVRAQRFSDIVVIQTKFNADPRYLILANAFNPRHLLSGAEMINKNYKLHMQGDDQAFADLSLSKEWNVLDFHSVIVHLFSEKCRKHFDIEQLWAVGEKYDGQINSARYSSAQVPSPQVGNDPR